MFTGLFTDVESRYDTSMFRIRIDFTKAGRRSFQRVNAQLGEAFIRFIDLARELAEYIERHIDQGDPMISEFDVRYEDGICLTVYCSGGTYFIEDVTNIGDNLARFPVYVWERVKRGCRMVLSAALVGWSGIFRPLQFVTVKCY